MNCFTANQLNLIEVLRNHNLRPIREYKNEAWYLSFSREEKTASLRVDKKKNTWHDFGDGSGRTVVDLIVKLKNYTVKEALVYLSKNTFSFHQQNTLHREIDRKEHIVSVKPIRHLALKNYLASRKIDIELAKKYCTEIHYYIYDSGVSEKNMLVKNKKKPFFAIGFKNDLGGYETRNKFFKGCLRSKAITTFENGSDTLNLFEGFLDFLSYLMLKPENEKEDFVIINSTSLVEKAIELLPKYAIVNTFFDNDSSGRKATEVIQLNTKNEFRDCSNLYNNHKDLNDFLIKLEQNNI